MILSNRARFLIGVGLGLAAGIAGCWALWHPRTPKLETHKQEERQKDGSLILERQQTTDEKTARAQIPVAPMTPKGAKLERLGKLEILPKLPPTPTAGPGIPGPGAVAPEAPKPLEVDVAIVKEKDGSQRLIGSSPDGTVVGGLDIPIGPPAPPVPSFKWAAGIDYTITSFGNIKSLVVQRQLGPMVLQAHAGVETFTPPGGGTLRGGAVGGTLLIRFGR